LLLEAYILVNKIKFAYSDVKKMTKIERMSFMKFYSDDIKQSQDE
tara:strand:+ start:32511 stop:32645 length:135 start_codon:yes stop_codon:yes gene_type:complete